MNENENADLTQVETKKLEQYRKVAKVALQGYEKYGNHDYFQKMLAFDDRILVELNRRLTAAPSIR